MHQNLGQALHLVEILLNIQTEYKHHIEPLLTEQQQLLWCSVRSGSMSGTIHLQFLQEINRTNTVHEVSNTRASLKKSNMASLRTPKK